MIPLCQRASLSFTAGDLFIKIRMENILMGIDANDK
jgi:hypothetical protein